MARPTVLTDDVIAALARHVGGGRSLAEVRRRLAAEGVHVSAATLSRHLGKRRTPKPPAAAARPSAPVAELEHAAAAAIEDGGLEGMRRNQRGVQAAIDELLPFAGSEARAAASVSRLIATNTALLQAIDSLTPRPEAAAKRELEWGTKAHAELLDRVRAQAHADENLRGRLAALTEKHERATAMNERFLTERYERLNPK